MGSRGEMTGNVGTLGTGHGGKTENRQSYYHRYVRVRVASNFEISAGPDPSPIVCNTSIIIINLSAHSWVKFFNKLVFQCYIKSRFVLMRHVISSSYY